MAYELTQIQKAQAIFYYLLEKHELKQEDEPEYYRAYLEQEDIQALVKSQGEIAKCLITRYGNVIYLIPDIDNHFLGYTKAELKRELCHSQATDKDYYLIQFVILVLLLEFYDGHGSSSKSRDYIRTGDLQNAISLHLREGAQLYQDDSSLLFESMLNTYEALRSKDTLNHQKTTKEGFLYHVLKFLQNQGLITYIEQDEMITTTTKLDHFMDWNLLNETNFNRITSLLKGENNDE